MEKLKTRAYITRTNQQRLNALKADLNASSSDADKLSTQDDALTYLFRIYQEYKKLKRNLDLMKELKKFQDNQETIESKSQNGQPDKF